ncbi:MAG: response regulator transcription factor [Chitinispirillaceae bacterium]|nr:response regulator transcription factor [Chitinispirillaceae bacterium]
MISVYIIDDMFYRYGLISILEKYPDFQIVGGGEDILSSISEIENLYPDVIILDAFPNNVDKTDEIEIIRNKIPQSRVLVFTQHHEDENCLKCIKLGARGYLQKGIKVEELVECIKLVANGDAMVFTSDAAKALEYSFLRNDRSKKNVNELSNREKEILKLVSQGISTKDISDKCFVSETTIKAHLKRIMEKLNAKNRAQAVAKAIDQGLLV